MQVRWLLLLSATLGVMTSGAPRAQGFQLGPAAPRPVVVNVDATRDGGWVSRSLYGFALSEIPHEPLLQALSAQGVALVAARAVVRERSLSEAQLAALHAFAQQAQQSGSRAVAWLQPAAHAQAVRRQLLACLRTGHLQDGFYAVESAESPRALELLDAASEGSAPSADPPALLHLYRLPQEPGRGAASPALGLVRRLRELADAGREMAAYASSGVADAEAAQLLRATRLLAQWGQLYGKRLPVSEAEGVIGVATRSDALVSVCLANTSADTTSARLRLRLPAGRHCVEVREIRADGFASLPMEKPPLVVSSSLGTAEMAVELAPHGVAVVRLCAALRGAYGRLQDLRRQLAQTPRLRAREKSRILNILAEARRPLQETLSAQKFDSGSVARAAHRALLQLSQAEASFANEVARGRVEETTAGALSGQFAAAVGLLSSASASGLGIRFQVESDSPCLTAQAPSTLRVSLAHQGGRAVAGVRIIAQSDGQLIAEPANAVFAQLAPNRDADCRFQVRLRQGAIPPLAGVEPLLLRVRVTYYADRSLVRLSRIVEFYRA